MMAWWCAQSVFKTAAGIACNWQAPARNCFPGSLILRAKPTRACCRLSRRANRRSFLRCSTNLRARSTIRRASRSTRIGLARRRPLPRVDQAPFEPGECARVNDAILFQVPDGSKSQRKAFVIDAAVNVALLLSGDGALVPRTGVGELTGARQTVAHVVQGYAEALVIDAAVNVALLLSSDGAFVPPTSVRELAGARQAVARLMQA